MSDNPNFTQHNKKPSRKNFTKGCACGCVSGCAFVVLVLIVIAGMSWMVLRQFFDYVDKQPAKLHIPEISKKHLEELRERRKDFIDGGIQELRLSFDEVSVLLTEEINKKLETKGTGCQFQERNGLLSIVCALHVGQLATLLTPQSMNEYQIYNNADDYESLRHVNYYINIQIEDSLENFPQNARYLHGLDLDKKEIEDPSIKVFALISFSFLLRILDEAGALEILEVMGTISEESSDNYLSLKSKAAEICIKEMIGDHLSIEDGEILLNKLHPSEYSDQFRQCLEKVREE